MDDYNSNFESVIEEEFSWHLNKYIKLPQKLTSQYPVSTICGEFRPDFIYQYETGRKVIFECDGKEFHDASRDEWRDAMILGDGFANRIFRIRGSDIKYHIADVLYLISKIEPSMFTQRGHINLNKLASHEAKVAEVCQRDIVHISYASEDSCQMSHLRLEYRSNPTRTGKREFWKAAYIFASKIGGGKLDEVIQSYRNQNI